LSKNVKLTWDFYLFSHSITSYPKKLIVSENSLCSLFKANAAHLLSEIATDVDVN